MFNDLARTMLSKISTNDGEICKTQQCYGVYDSFSSVEMYISADKVTFRVSGEPYVVAMMKWLQLNIQNGVNISVITLKELVDKFGIPELKYRSAIQIVDLIEKINER